MNSSETTNNSVEKSEFFKAAVLYSLRNFETHISFTKADGTERKMRCTLMESALPKREESTAEKKPHSPDVQPVWDLDAGGWRSFRWDSIISFRGVKENSNV